MSIGDLGLLNDAEYASLSERVDRFVTARRTDPAAPLEPYLPPHGSRLRPFVLVELIKADMELRHRANLPIRVESYIEAYPDDLSAARVPVSLLTEEYRFRRRRPGDKPTLEEYRRRFPAQYEALVERLSQDISATRASVGFETVTDVHARPRNTPSKELSGVALPDGYRPIRVIGSGTFGEVIEAEAPGGVRVAIKRITRSMDDPSSKGEIEALEAIKSLSHPYLIKTNAYWVLEDRLVIAMDLADGNLEGLLKARRNSGLPGIPPDELMPIIEQTAAGLDFLHENGVTHRDVKPENILLQKGYAKVGDFGLARTQNHTQTMINSPMGTLPFMAPEVIGNTMCPQSDQYSLAASYVRARLGRLLFPGVPAQVMMACQLTATPNLSELPKPERKVLLKALAKTPEARYPSCVAFAKALHEAVFPPPTPTAFVPLWIKFALAALLGGLLLGWLDSDGRDPPRWSAHVPLPVPPTASPVVPTAAARLYVPPGWSPVVEAGVATHVTKEYYKKIYRPVAGQKVEALLILPVRPGDPAPFYMTKDKITNWVFKAEWERTGGFRSFLERQPALRAQLLPGKWRELRVGKDGAKVLKAEDRPEAPVLGVTVPEAMLVAQELGGQLPSCKQWQKAVGVLDNRQPGPAGPAIEVPPHLQGLENFEARQAFLRAELANRNLALGLTDGPWPVTNLTADRAPVDDEGRLFIHQLVSNGPEWLGEDSRTRARLNLGQLPATKLEVVIAGQGHEQTEILTTDVILEKDRAQSWTKWEEQAGFRIVIDNLP